MQITLTWQTLITAAAVLAAATAIATAIAKLVRWIDRQKNQDKEILAMQKQHDDDLDQLRREHAEVTASINEELALLTHGILACLKGQQEQGCNGPVTEAIQKIERHINKKAHKNRGGIK